MGSHDPLKYLQHKLWLRKRGQESICHFDSRPLKFRNFPNLQAWKGRVTYRWKAFDEGYNFALDLTLIKGLQKKLWVSKVVEVPILGILGLLTWESQEKWHLGATPMAKHKNTITKKVVVFSSLNYGESCEFVYARDLFVHQKCSNYALTNLFGLCRFIRIIDPLVIFLSFHPKVPTHPFYPKIATNLRACPNSFFYCFHFGICIRVFSKGQRCINKPPYTKKSYLLHSLTKLNVFCGIGNIKWKSINNF
jgi:hypothetical protein